MAELDGRPVTPEVLQALALTNFGHFTSMRVDDGGVRGLSRHLARLVRDCRTVFAADLDPRHVRRLVRQAVRGRTRPVGVRVTVFDPGLELGRPAAAASPHVLVTCRAAAPAGLVAPAELGAVLPPLRVTTRGYQRELATVKHVGLFGALHHRRAAQLDGFDDALFTHDGLITEGPTWNVGFYDGEEVVWPSADVLPGVTMALLRQAREHVTAPVTLGELGRMRAAFVTNASIGVRAVASIDDVALQVDHPVLDALRADYAAISPEPL